MSRENLWRYACDTRGGAILYVTCEWVISMNDMGHIYTVYTYMYMSHIGSHIYRLYIYIHRVYLYDTHTWLIHMWSMTQFYTSLVNESFLWMTWVTYIPSIHICTVCTIHTHDAFTCDRWRVSRIYHLYVTSHVNESCHLWMSHVKIYDVIYVTQRDVQVYTSLVNESCHIWRSHVAHCRLSHVTHYRRYRQKGRTIVYVTCEWVMSHMKITITL